MTELLTLFIVIGSTFKVANDSVTVNMVNFSGHAKSEYFEGRILPGGVDTQTYRPGAPATLSARYMVEGVDSVGKKCRVYVSNEVRPTSPKGYTEPTIVTDSPYLTAKARKGLLGKIEMRGEQLVIRVFAKDK